MTAQQQEQRQETEQPPSSIAEAESGGRSALAGVAPDEGGSTVPDYVKYQHDPLADAIAEGLTELFQRWGFNVKVDHD